MRRFRYTLTHLLLAIAVIAVTAGVAIQTFRWLTRMEAVEKRLAETEELLSDVAMRNG